MRLSILPLVLDLITLTTATGLNINNWCSYAITINHDGKHYNVSSGTQIYHDYLDDAGLRKRLYFRRLTADPTEWMFLEYMWSAGAAFVGYRVDADFQRTISMGPFNNDPVRVLHTGGSPADGPGWNCVAQYAKPAKTSVYPSHGGSDFALCYQPVRFWIDTCRNYIPPVAAAS